MWERKRAGRERSSGPRDGIEGPFEMGKTQVADDASVSRQPAPRGPRADRPPAPEGITTIGQGVVVKGEVKGGEDLLVDGKVDGTIELPEHTLTVGSTGMVTAQLSAKSVVVLGKVNGNIRASEQVRIGEAGLVEGAVSAPRLVMADGAQLQGRVDM